MVSELLYERGLEKEAATHIASEFISKEDEVYLSNIIHHLEHHEIVSKEEVLHYLSKAALRKQELDFNKYDHLVGMVSKIKKSPLTQEMKDKLSKIAKINRELFV